MYLKLYKNIFFHILHFYILFFYLIRHKKAGYWLCTLCLFMLSEINKKSNGLLLCRSVAIPQLINFIKNKKMADFKKKVPKI